MVKNTPGEMPFPWSEKDPYKLPVSIDRVQKLLLQQGEWDAGAQQRMQSMHACITWGSAACAVPPAHFTICIGTAYTC